MTGIAYHLGVLVKGTLAHFQWRSLPFFPPPLNLLVRHLHAESVGYRVDVDHVSVLHERDRTTDLGFGDDVPDDESMGAGVMTYGQLLESVMRDITAYPPLNRPSVRHATSYPKPAPIIKLVGLSISGIPVNSPSAPVPPLTWTQYSPGPPFGPKYLKTTTVFSPFLILPLSTALTNESSSSNARHLPVNLRPSFPVILDTDPPGARLPVRILWQQLISNEESPIHLKIDVPNVTSLLDRVLDRSNDILTFPELLVLGHPLVDVLAKGLASDGHSVASHQTLFDEVCHHACPDRM